MEKKKRENAANKLKSAYNLLWNEAIKINSERGRNYVVSYMDIVRISDAIRSEGAEILGLENLPRQIDSGLKFATAALDPNKARAEETIKNGLAGLGGAGGLALASICLAQFMNPGLWAGVVAVFVGGVAAGPFVIVGITAGLAVAAGAVYTAFQKMSPEERTVKAHAFVMKGIDNWIEHGSDEKPIDRAQVENIITKDSSDFDLSIEDTIAVATILLNIANADGIFLENEETKIQNLLNDFDVDKRIKTSDALEHIKNFSAQKTDLIINWCFQVAHSDEEFHENEVDILQRYCKKLGVDFNIYASQYGIMLS